MSKHKPRPEPKDYPPSQRLQDALAAMGCQRPDKNHHRNQADAQAHLDRMAAKPGHDHSAAVYPCRCGMGWVWGRLPGPRPGTGVPSDVTDQPTTGDPHP